MWRIQLPWGDDYLIFRLPFKELGSFGQWSVVIGGFFVLMGLILFLYRYESRLVERRFALILLGLRTLVVLVIYCVTTLQPMRGHIYTETIPSRVVIGLDRSDSMAITDSQRPDRETLELAKGLKLAGDLATESQFNSWLRQIEVGVELTSDPAFQRLKVKIDALSRGDIAERVLFLNEGRFIKELSSAHRLRITGFSQEGSDLPLEIDALREVLKLPLKKGVNFTDLKIPLEKGLEGGSTEGELLGVILLTDGQHNWGATPVSRVQELANRGVPIYSIALGSSIPPTDLAVTSVKGTSTVFKNTDAFIEARLLVNNIPPGKLKVTVRWPERPEEKSPTPLIETVEHDGTTQTYTVRFQARMERAGTEVLTVTAEIDPNHPNSPKDRFPENNSREIVINVAPDKAKVFVVDGEPRWEYHYLATALNRDPTMEIRTVVIDQPRINAVDLEGLRAMNYPEQTLPNDPEILLTQDCIILGDVTTEQLPLSGRETLEKFVGERGGTLVLLAGKRALPLEFMKLDNDPLGKMIPLRDAKVIDSKTGFVVSLTGEGRQTPFLKMEAETGDSLERWTKLPGHFWGIVGKAKDGAVTLGSYSEIRGARIIDPEFEKNNALLIRQNYGFGRVVYVGIDSTWRWRFKTGDQYHHRFWGQLIRWAASDRPLITGNEFLRFGTREPVYRADQEVEMLVRLSEKVRKLGDETLAGAKLYRKTPDGKEEYVGITPLKKNAANPKELTAQQRDLPAGEYFIELLIPDLESKLNGPDGRKLRAPFKVLPPETGELINLAANWQLLEDLAVKTGGKVVHPENAEEILQLLQSRSTTKETPVETRLWESWWTLLLVVGLLTIEWGLRKWVGLP